MSAYDPLASDKAHYVTLGLNTGTLEGHLTSAMWTRDARGHPADSTCTEWSTTGKVRWRVCWQRTTVAVFSLLAPSPQSLCPLHL